jgi:hypothetical protein
MFPHRYRMDRSAPMNSSTREVTTPTSPTRSGGMPPQSEPATSSQPWKTHDGDTARMAIVTTTTASAAIAHPFTYRSYRHP